LDPEDYEVVSTLVVPPSRHLVVPAGCRIASCRPLIVPPSRQLVAPACCCIASPHPLIALPSRRLFPPAGCPIASRCPLAVPPSCQLVAPACCCIASPRPLVAPRTALSSSPRAIWLLRRLSMRRPLIVSSSCRVTSRRCLVALSLHRPLVLLSCWLVVVSPVLAPPSHPLIAVHRQRHQTPSNAAAAIEHHRHRRH